MSIKTDWRHAPATGRKPAFPASERRDAPERPPRARLLRRIARRLLRRGLNGLRLMARAARSAARRVRGALTRLQAAAQGVLRRARHTLSRGRACAQSALGRMWRAAKAARQRVRTAPARYGSAARARAARIARWPGWDAHGAKVLAPLNLALSVLLRRVKHRKSVLHISYMVHIPYYAARLLRDQGMKADYLALEENPKIWSKCDYLFIPPAVPLVRLWREFFFFWKVVARYEIIHSHFGMRHTTTGWELPILKRMGRKIVIHFRGCEVRHRERNMALHPECNICEHCDYNGVICNDPVRRQRRRLAEQYGDLFLITTPDMKDFVPDAIYFPFFLPQIRAEDYAPASPKWPQRSELRIVHVTGHPGIEGTEEIRKAIGRLQAKGHPVTFRFLHLVNHDHVLREIAEADLTIGKMKMGYYANAQIESMFLGVPAITHVRPEFMTPELESSGFIFSTLARLEETIEHYLLHPESLEKKRQLARSSILKLHDNHRLGARLIGLYESIGKRGS